MKWLSRNSIIQCSNEVEQEDLVDCMGHLERNWFGYENNVQSAEIDNELSPSGEPELEYSYEERLVINVRDIILTHIIFNWKGSKIANYKLIQRARV